MSGGDSEKCLHISSPPNFPHSLQNFPLFFSFSPDGWTKSDLVYSWFAVRPVQIPGNLSLPGGFKLGGYGNQYCDVITTTGRKVTFIVKWESINSYNF